MTTTTPRLHRVPADPALNPGDAAWFEAAGQGRLILRQCRSCGKPHHFPREICPFCWSTDVEWRETSGLGEIYSYSVTRKAGPLPYCIAYVVLDEGPMMLTNIVETDLDRVHIGQRVEVCFHHSANGTAIPMFRPVTHGGVR